MEYFLNFIRGHISITSLYKGKLSVFSLHKRVESVSCCYSIWVNLRIYASLQSLKSLHFEPHLRHGPREPEKKLQKVNQCSVRHLHKKHWVAAAYPGARLRSKVQACARWILDKKQKNAELMINSITPALTSIHTHMGYKYTWDYTEHKRLSPESPGLYQISSLA